MRTIFLRCLRAGFAACLVIAAGGCASQVSDAFGDETFRGPSLQQVRSVPLDYAGQLVRWGGTIASVENLAETTRIEIVALPLTSSGRPRESNDSAGRFIADFPGFLDPVIYASGRTMTVIGYLESSVSGKIGEHAYQFPLIRIKQHRLWKKRPQRQIIYYRDPFYSSPFFNDPWLYHYYRRPY